MTRQSQPDLTDRTLYSQWSRDVLRFGDTDRQSHVNNASFATFCETGRVAFLCDPSAPLAPEGCQFVIARLVLDFRGEIMWPGSVDIGSGLLSIGRSSFSLGQGLYVGERCVATAETVIVLTDERTRRSTPLPDVVRAKLSTMVIA